MDSCDSYPTVVSLCISALMTPLSTLESIIKLQVHGGLPRHTLSLSLTESVAVLWNVSAQGYNNYGFYIREEIKKGK